CVQLGGALLGAQQDAVLAHQCHLNPAYDPLGAALLLDNLDRHLANLIEVAPELVELLLDVRALVIGHLAVAVLEDQLHGVLLPAGPWCCASRLFVAWLRRRARCTKPPAAPATEGFPGSVSAHSDRSGNRSHPGRKRHGSCAFAPLLAAGR